MSELTLFWVFGVGSIVAASAVIGARNPVHSAMALVATFFFLAVLYVLLWAHTIAVLQVLVYAGAIMVLFLFVIMLLNLAESPGRPKVTFATVVGSAATAALLLALESALTRLPGEVAELPRGQAAFGSIKALGQLLYTHYLFPFEAVSLLLLVAMVGAVIVAKARI